LSWAIPPRAGTAGQRLPAGGRKACCSRILCRLKFEVDYVAWQAFDLIRVFALYMTAILTYMQALFVILRTALCRVYGPFDIGDRILWL
jgi:hypothetical protein